MTDGFYPYGAGAQAHVTETQIGRRPVTVWCELRPVIADALVRMAQAGLYGGCVSDAMETIVCAWMREHRDELVALGVWGSAVKSDRSEVK